MRNYNPVIWIIIFLSLSATFLMIERIISMYDTVVFQLFTILGIIVVDFLMSKRITLFQIWGVSYIYIIWSEMMIISVDTPYSRYLNTFTFLLVAKSVLDIGYMTFMPKKLNKKLNTAWYLMKPKTFFAVMVVMLISWLISNYTTVMVTLNSGRQYGNVLGSSVDVFGVLVSASSLMLPAMAAYYYRWHSKKSVLWSLIFILPVFLFQFILGTRSRLIYMLLPWLILMGIIDVKNQKNKTLVYVLVGIAVLSLASRFMKDHRTESLIDFGKESGVVVSDKIEKDPFVRLAGMMSPEGCVYMTYLAEDWFSNHEHSYGREIGFMFYWVVPRAIWKNKPTPVDHWLIRKYQNVGDHFSTASGFTGEIRADFGYWCIIIVFFFGWILRKADLFVLKAYSSDEPYLEKVLAALIYPCVFYFVRSPLTSTQYLFVEVLLLWAISRWLGQRRKLKRLS